jgi:hypothetical protein
MPEDSGGDADDSWWTYVLLEDSQGEEAGSSTLAEDEGAST